MGRCFLSWDSTFKTKNVKALIFFLLFVISCQLGYAQRLRIPELPDDLYSNELKSHKQKSLQTRLKGIAVEYTLSAPYQMESDFPEKVVGTVKYEERFKVKYRIPVLLKDRWKVFLGHTFDRTRFVLDGNFDNSSLVSAIDGVTLKGNRFSAFGIFQRTPVESYTAAFTLSVNGNYEKFADFSEQYRVYRFIGAYRRQTDLNNSWGVGIYYKNGFRSNTLLPFGLWNKTFNEKWGFEAILITEFHMRYNYDDNNIFLMGYEYKSQDYSVDINYEGKISAYEFKWPKIIFSGIWQHRFLPILWSEVRTGFQYNWEPSTELDGREVPADNLHVRSHSLMFNVGLFLTPPDKWLNN